MNALDTIFAIYLIVMSIVVVLFGPTAIGEPREPLTAAKYAQVLVLQTLPTAWVAWSVVL